MSRLTAEQRLAYAERSLDWGAGQKTEDELLQRVWNLATDVQALVGELALAQQGAAEARAACEKAIRERRSLERKEDDWHSAYDRLQARVAWLEAEASRLRLKLGEECDHALIAGTRRCIKCGAALALDDDGGAG